MHIIKYLGEINIYELNEDNINKFIDELNWYLDPKTVKDIICILKEILKFAEKKYDLNFKLELISVPKKEKDEVEVFAQNEIRKLEKNCIKNINDFRKLGIIFCLNTGIRIGEMCALTWKDIDMKNQVIKVSHTMQRIYKSKNNTEIIITTPKSKKSIRTIPINKKLYKILKETRENNKCGNDAFFLTGKSDKIIEPRNYEYAYEKILKESKISYKKFHTLRHTFATNCIEIGMDIKSLSEILGHSNVNITLNTYVHSSLKNKRKYLEKL